MLGLNAVVQAGPILAFALVGGLIADRFDRYRLTVASYVIQIIPDAALAWLVMSDNIRVVGDVRTEYVIVTLRQYRKALMDRR